MAWDVVGWLLTSRPHWRRKGFGSLGSPAEVPQWVNLCTKTVTAGQSVHCDDYRVSGPVVGEQSRVQGSWNKSNGFIWCHANMFCPENATALCRHISLFKLDSLVHRDQIGRLCWIHASGLALGQHISTVVDFNLHRSENWNFFRTSLWQRIARRHSSQ